MTRPSSRRRWTLRSRLTAASALAIAAGIALASFALVWRLQTGLTDTLKSTVTQSASNVAAALTAGKLPAALTTSTDASVIQIVDHTGRVLAASANVDGEPPLFTWPQPIDRLTVREVSGVPLGGEGDYLVAATRAPAASAGTVTVFAGTPLAPVQASVRELTAELLLAAPILVAALAALAWLLVGRALRPVEDLRRQAALLSGTDLHRRLLTAPGSDELGRLAGTFNDLLSRIEAATDRQRRFVADAAHELRSPIAALAAQLEIDQRHPHLSDRAAARADMSADVARLARLVEDLLTLARLDARAPRRRKPVDLDDLLRTEARRVDAGLAVDCSEVSPARVFGDPDALQRVVRNLLENAARYARGTITVSSKASETQATITIADDGPGIAEADRQRVFDRFTRLDDARDREHGGAGLGLAIARDVVHAHGGEIYIEDNEPGARFTATLPRLSP